MLLKILIYLVADQPSWQKVRPCDSNSMPVAAACACTGSLATFGIVATAEAKDNYTRFGLRLVKARPNEQLGSGAVESWTYYHLSRSWEYGDLSGVHFIPVKIHEFLDDGSGWNSSMPACSTPRVPPCLLATHHMPNGAWGGKAGPTHPTRPSFVPLRARFCGPRCDTSWPCQA